MGLFDSPTTAIFLADFSSSVIWSASLTLALQRLGCAHSVNRRECQRAIVRSRYTLRASLASVSEISRFFIRFFRSFVVRWGSNCREISSGVLGLLQSIRIFE